MLGTSIQDLHKSDGIRNLQDMQQVQYGAMQNSQLEQAHNADHQMHQAQHNPYYAAQNCSGYPQFNKQTKQPPTYFNPVSPQQEALKMDIEELTKDISDNLPEDTFASVGDTSEEQHGKGNKLLNFIPEVLREPLLIVVIYIILSQPFVKESLGKHIKQINPNAEGVVSFTGVLIYGVLLAVLYALAKKFIL